MVCILCLDIKSDNEPSLQIFSEEGEALSVRAIILQHFWIEPKEDETHQWICRQCWSSLSDFHHFYLRIEEAHQSLQQLKQEFNKIVDPISSEKSFITTRNRGTKESVASPEVAESNKIGPLIAKRKRGRPKLSKDHDVLEEIPIDTNTVMAVDEVLNVESVDDIDIFSGECKPENDVVSTETGSTEETVYIVPKKKRGRPPSLRKKTNKTKNTTEKVKPEQMTTDMMIKTELEIDEIMDDDFDLQLTATAAESHDSDEECTIAGSNNKYAERKTLSLSFDEIIAKNFKLTCCLCQLPLENFTHLKTHFRVEHKMRGYAFCCGKKLLKRGLLVDHIHTHQDPEYFKCAECGKVMSDRRCLEGHMKTHQAKGQPAFQCEICLKSYHRRVVYVRHVQSHMPEELKKFECPECSKKFATHYFMNQHLKVVHLNTYSKICDVCGKKIHGRDALQRHQALHDSVPPPPIQCELCGLTVTTKYGLTRHMKARHIADYQQPQVCPYCSKMSPSSFALKRHIYYMHNIKRRHACPMCEKAFKRSKDLREHMTTHTGDVLYTCSYCPKTFNSDANMYAHRKKAHRKEWEEKMREKFPLANIKGEANNPMPESESEDTVFS